MPFSKALLQDRIGGGFNFLRSDCCEVTLAINSTTKRDAAANHTDMQVNEKMSSFVEGRSGSVLGRHSEGDVRKLELKIEADSSGGAGADGTEVTRFL